jgi:flagellar biosynthetic protein FliR
MTTTNEIIFIMLLAFIRASAMLLVSPLFTTGVPVMIRVFTAGALAIAVTPIIGPFTPPPPEDLYGLIAAGFHEAIAGALIGLAVQLIAVAGQVAGSLMDIQIGLSSSQILNPAIGSTTVLANFKYLLTLVTLFSANAHQVMIRAFAAIYDGLLMMLSRAFFVGLQIALPVVAVSFVIDIAAAIVNKAVPQMQVFFVAMPAKIGVGLVALGLALPTVTSLVTNGVESTFGSLEQIFMAGNR